ncbi:MAG: F0F1 ATP synthase subunit gamma [Alphaproteobacteria bacterium]|nr:F0F1 ATP synthase subunit gamma [Alphaproteobacteria bacterium]
MPSLKELRSRIGSVKSTQRITSAMKMVAAAKLRRAQDLAMASRPYSERMERILTSLAASSSAESVPLLGGNGKDETHLLVFVSTDRGLCGGFNINLMRQIRRQVRTLQDQGKTVKLFCVGRKGVALVRREYPAHLVAELEDVSKPAPSYDSALEIARQLTEMFEAGDFDVCTIVYNKFVSALTQEVTPQQLIPFALPAEESAEEEAENAEASEASYEYEPSEEEILTDLLPRNLAVQVYRALLESFASEQGARMTAMDNATRNAGDLINRLTINYNRTRQAFITKELIEIISGAEAL